jgi:arylformamidase
MKKPLAIFLSLLISTQAFAQSHPFLEKIKQRLAEHQLSNQTNKIIPTFADIPYGTNPLQKIDVYLPQIATQNMPILVMVHGGGWNRGDKDKGAALQNKVPYYNNKGFIVISVNYRLSPEANPVEQAYDIGKALTFIQANALTWSGDSSKVVLMGHSAGAHLVTLVTANKHKFAPNAAAWVGTISLDGAGVDIEKSMLAKKSGKLLGNIYDNAFGDNPKIWNEASPMAQLQSGSNPLLMVCSSSRKDNPCEDTLIFTNKANSLAITATTFPVNSTHSEINANVGLNNNLTQVIDKFIKTNGVNF